MKRTDEQTESWSPHYALFLLCAKSA